MSPRSSNPGSAKTPWNAPIVYWLNPDIDCDSARRGAALQLPEVDKVNDTGDWVLSADEQGLVLKDPQGLVLRSSFGRENALQRAAQTGFIQDTFAKAMGVARLQKGLTRAPRIIDATGGLGQDAMTLASLGCEVTVIERHPILYCLLIDMMAGLDNVSGINDDAIACLSSIATSKKTDIIYLDPMYPEQRRRGKTKKGMQILHELLGPDTNNDSLLNTALDACQDCDAYRVVVKRAKGAAPLIGNDGWSKQITTIESPNTRYDIYHNHPIKSS